MTRHIINISGGKDSTALAIYMNNKYPNKNYEYVFCDTGCELPETYEYLDKIEQKLGIKIIRLNSHKPFEFYLEKMNGYLPSTFARWCTREMKIKPWEEYIGLEEANSYIAIRSDEYRKGYISNKKNVHPVYPFIQDKVTLEDVNRILTNSGIGLPEYYKWRSRSGCYFCMFQRRIEWINLFKNHPLLFKKALDFEKDNFTWIKGMSLLELLYRGKDIEERYKRKNNASSDDNDYENCCTICNL